MITGMLSLLFNLQQCLAIIYHGCYLREGFKWFKCDARDRPLKQAIVEAMWDKSVKALLQSKRSRFAYKFTPSSQGWHCKTPLRGWHPPLTRLLAMSRPESQTLRIFYHVPKTVSRILGLQPNAFLYLILSVFPAYNVLSCVCQLCNKEYMIITACS